MNDTPRILFIDEDPGILAALQTLLQNEEWECHFVSSAGQALQHLVDHPVDLVVSAAVMQEMDGNSLLWEIRERHPTTIRLLLTGHPHHTRVLQALAQGSTQQIIPKPWIDLELKEILRSALRQAHYQRKYGLELQKLINTIPLLPTLPETYSQVRACISDDDIDIEGMAEAISEDVSLSATLLHWGNSALFGQRFLVDSIKKAIIVLGTDIVENLVLSEAVYRAVKTDTSKVPGFDINRFKKHSIACATISRLLIKLTYSSNVGMQDRAFIAGLLHDIGKLLLANYLPDKFQQAIDLADTNQWSLLKAEPSIYDTDHAEIGAMLAQWWNLPPFLVEAIRSHHHLRTTPIEPEVSAAAYAGNILACQFNFCARQGTNESDLPDGCYERFHLNDEVIDLLKHKTREVLSQLPT
ncbi:response regulator [Pelovirga terrestris]|uniref:HDOD domain-containing protein n=1 Tax=Pelovirga terrestris TaxID=2771352 RepID=A0A8J6ULS4_9BACT|nr:response regulator [Pelovirga terrestris]MBD1401687.1 HDOD domain-containing protein [Pelovirga terrestris]